MLSSRPIGPTGLALKSQTEESKLTLPFDGLGALSLSRGTFLDSCPEGVEGSRAVSPTAKSETRHRRTGQRGLEMISRVSQEKD